MKHNLFMASGRRTGIDHLGDVQKAGHYCLFYRTKADLLAILVPYFITGLEEDELCRWIIPAFLDKAEAREALSEATNQLERYLASGQMSILTTDDWYMTGGRPDPKRPMRELVKTCHSCQGRGFRGVRLAGDPSGIVGLHWKDILANRKEADASLDTCHILSICCYRTDYLAAHDVVDIVQYYQSALFKAEGQSGRVAPKDLDDTEKALEEREDLYYQWLELSPDPVFIYSEGKVRYANTAGIRLAEARQREDVIGRSVLDFVPAEDRPLVETRLPDQLLLNVQRQEMRFLTLEGKVLDIELVAGPATYMGMRARQVLIHDVTGIKQERAALEASEARYRLLAENITDVICIMDQDLYLTYASPSIKLVTGFSPEEVMGMNLAALVLPDSFELAQKQFDQYTALPGVSTWINDVVARCKDGGTVCLEARISQLNNASGGPNGFITMARDVSERRRVEAELVKSEERFRTIYEKSPTGIALMDKDGYLTSMNRAFRQLFAFPVNYAPRNYSVFGDPSISVSVKKKLRKGEPVAYEGPFDLATSKVRSNYQTLREDMYHISVTITPLKGETEDNLTGYLLQLEDITERKSAEQALRASESRYRAMFENTLDGKVVIEKSTRSIVLANQAMARMHGFTSPRELVGMDPLSLVVPEDQETLELVIRQIFEDASSGVTRFRTQTKGGKELWVSAIGISTEFEGKTAGFMSLRDITDWERSQHKLQDLYRKERRLRHELEEEMQKRADFLRALVHELKTPLTPVLAASSALLANLPEGTSQELARNIYRGALRLNSRTDELVDLARGEIGLLELVCEPVDILEVLEEVSKDMDPVFASRGQSLVFVLPIDLPRVQADQYRLRQIVLNLLNNACKYTPDGGKITVQASETESDIVVRISDTGTGIPRPMRARLFDPYQQLEMGDRRSGGLGTGLALSKRLIELHGGRIWVRSRKGEGSTFVFSIPIAGPGDNRARRRPSKAPQGDG